MRTFLGVDVAVPDAPTLLGFRHLLEEHQLTPKILQEVNAHLAEQQLFRKEGIIVDATIIAAPSSTKTSRRRVTLRYTKPRKGTSATLG